MSFYDRFRIDYPDFVSVDAPGYAHTIPSSRVSSWLDDATEFFSAASRSNRAYSSVASQHTVSDCASQRTFTGPTSHFGEVPQSDDSGSSDGSGTARPKYGGLQHDNEAKETRKEMLKRRRQECEADEVAVAMAPVLKIPTSYVFYPEQWKRFRAMFPRVTPDPGLSYTHHDHPVAHTATLVGMRHVQSMFKSGEKVLDVFGNPNGNEAFNRFQARRVAKRPGLAAPPEVHSMVDMNSAMDAVRAKTKWGPQEGSDGKARYFRGQLSDIPTGYYNVFTAIHTLYYMTMLEVAKLMKDNKDAKLIALVNYSPEQCGTLYGELKFSKSGGMTTQTSPNGEKYDHPDVDQWFQTNSFRHCPEAGTDMGSYGISWTSKCIGGPLYVIEIVWCPGQLARRKPYHPPAAPTLQVSSGCYIAWVHFGGRNVQLRISNHDLAAELRHFMTLRDRSNPQTLADLTVKARRATSPDLVTGVRQFHVNPGELQDHIIYAYLVDAPGELDLLEGVKLLKGDLLVPHAQALKLEGKLNKDGFFTALINALGGGSPPKPALGARTGKKQTINQTANSAGLLPVHRT